MRRGSTPRDLMDGTALATGIFAAMLVLAEISQALTGL